MNEEMEIDRLVLILMNIELLTKVIHFICSVIYISKWSISSFVPMVTPPPPLSKISWIPETNLIHCLICLPGFTDRKVEDEFAWDDCTVPSSGSWSDPSGNTGDKDCVILDSAAGELVAKNCSEEFDYVCEFTEGENSIRENVCGVCVVRCLYVCVCVCL